MSSRSPSVDWQSPDDLSPPLHINVVDWWEAWRNSDKDDIYSGGSLLEPLGYKAIQSPGRDLTDSSVLNVSSIVTKCVIVLKQCLGSCLPFTPRYPRRKLCPAISRKHARHQTHSHPEERPPMSSFSTFDGFRVNVHEPVFATGRTHSPPVQAPFF